MLLTLRVSMLSAVTVAALLAQQPFQTPEGKKGWKVEIPGKHGLATPAVSGGSVFVGGGFGSREFYALDAATGKRLWVYQTKDDGPTVRGC